MKRYSDLFTYYKACFSLFDCFHFNSEVSKKVYRKWIKSGQERVLPITHLGIKDCRKKKCFREEILRIGFIGSEEPFKGLPKLIEVLEKLHDTHRWNLSVWGGRVAQHPTLPVHYKGQFNTEQIQQVYQEMDVLVVPSIWKETFSLVTLEALSYGVPVIVSDNVGAQDLVREYNPKFIFHTLDELQALLSSLINDKSALKTYNQRILEKPWKHDMLPHAQEIIDKIYRGSQL